MYSSSWIDGLQHLVLLRKKAIPELHEYIVNKMHHHDRENEHIQVMIQFFEELYNDYVYHQEALSIDSWKNIWIDDDSENDHLPIPVYSYINPQWEHNLYFIYCFPWDTLALRLTSLYTQL